MARRRRIVVKVGSSTLTGTDGRVDREYLRGLVTQMVTLRDADTDVVLVSSGAIAAGLEALGLDSRPEEMSALQAAASVGQVRLIGTYADLFGDHGVPIGQVLLTRHDTTHRQQYVYACQTLDDLLDRGVVPVVNENDTTAVEEIRFGDNDTLASLVAIMVHADLAILLTDIEGLYSADPRTDHEACLVDYVDELTEEILSAVGGPGSPFGSGGMATKLDSAKVLMKAGIPLVVADGRRDGVVLDAAAGEPVGTYFEAGKSAVKGRKLWIAYGRRAAGTITIDDGAKHALLSRGKSLLAAGVTHVEGEFAAGDAVVLADGSGTAVARGLTRLSSADLMRIKGLKSSEIPGVLPGYSGEEVVHRDCLVIL